MKNFLFLLCAASMIAQQAEAPKKIRLEGKVVGEAGEAVSKATLRLTDSSSGPLNAPTTSTDNDGKFTFEDVVAGRYTLMASKDGFISGAYGVRSAIGTSGTFLNLKAGAELKDLVIKMMPQSVISGKVTDQDGDPVAGLQITAMRYDYVRGRRQFVASRSFPTDDQGDYRLTNLTPGKYYVQAWDPRTVRNLLAERPGRATPEASLVTYYPNAPDSVSASPVDVAAGADLRGIDIRMRRTRVYSVTGTVKPPPGNSTPSGMQLVLASKGSDAAAIASERNYSLTQVQPDGTFEFRNLRTGTFEMIGVPGPSPNGQPATLFSVHQEVTVNASDIAGLEVPLTPLGAIDGTITVENSDLQAVLKPSSPGATPVRLAVQLSQSEGLPVRDGAAQPKEDGSFQIPAAAAVKYWWTVSGLPEGTYVKSVRFGGKDVTRAVVDNTSGAGGMLQIVLAGKAASLTGSVKNEKGEIVTGATLRAWPKIPDQGSRTSSVQITTTDQDGAFRFAGLAPGEYYVAAWEDLNQGLGQSAEFLAHFSEVATLVKLEESGSATVEVKLIPGERVAAEIARLP